jgi:hypothetical protein
MDRHARRGVSSHTHAHPQTHIHTRQAWGVITRHRGGRDWARRLSLTRRRCPPERPRCSAIALAGSRMVRSEVVHIVGLQVDVSSYTFAAVLGGSPSEAHCMVHRLCATVECSCIALSLADSRRARSEPVHVDGTRVDASKDVPTAGVRGSPATLHAPGLDASSPQCRAKHRSTTAVVRSACRACTCTHQRRGTLAADAARRQNTADSRRRRSIHQWHGGQITGWPSVAVKGGTGADGSARKMSATKIHTWAASGRPRDRGGPTTQHLAFHYRFQTA